LPEDDGFECVLVESTTLEEVVQLFSIIPSDKAKINIRGIPSNNEKIQLLCT
jgi:hypothetical protein